MLLASSETELPALKRPEMGHRIQTRNSKGLGALTRASSNPAAQRLRGGTNSQATDFDSQTTKRVHGVYGYTTHMEDKFVRGRATRSIFDGDAGKKPANEAGRSNHDLSWATPSSHDTGFLNQAPDKQNRTLRVTSKRPAQ